MKVSVRFAPSPTGLLHIGNIRAALFNYVFARRHGGSFMLRLDDTDQSRSTPAFAEAIERDLGWLGLTWDRKARQAERLARYDEVLAALKASGRIYPCFETQTELELKRKTQLGRGLPPLYDRAALKLTEADRARLIAEGRAPHWRFRLDGADVVWDDLIQGRKSYPTNALSDPVLVREDGVPLYTFCSVIDDVDFGITHVIRGEDHVTNTAVQIQIAQAISDAPPTVFAHFPLLVSASGTEMSKRLGTLSIASMRDEMGIEPMAINALLARLGTSDPVEAVGSLDTLVQTFDIGHVSRATPKFDENDLMHLNARLLHTTPFEAVRDRLEAMGCHGVTPAFWTAVAPNLTVLRDALIWWKVAYGPIAPTITDPAFIADAARLLPGAPWSDATWRDWTRAVGAETGRKGRDLYMPLRLALTGAEHGPELKDLLPIIGQSRAAARLEGRVA